MVSLLEEGFASAGRRIVQYLHFRDFKILITLKRDCGFEITQALILNKNPGFSMPSGNFETLVILNQSRYFNMDPIDARFIEYAEKFTKSESKQIRELKKTTQAELEYADMMSGKVVGALLKLLIRLQKATSVLEIGTFVGYGTLNMAEALSNNGKITTIECNERYIEIAKAAFERSPDSKNITLMEGEAEKILKQLQQTYDLIFLDADKGNYQTYMPLIVPRLKPGGVLVIDNAYWKGGVWQREDEKSESIHNTNKYVADHPELEHFFLTVRDGLMIARKGEK